MTNKQKIYLGITSLLLSAVLAVSVVMIYREHSARQNDIEIFNNIAQIVSTAQSEQTEPDDTSVPTEKKHIDYMNLLAINSDCFGWINIPDTAVNYPVMHTPKNPQKYLRKNIYGEYSVSGVPFMDGRCDIDSDNITVYGHNMRNGTMFSSLKDYLNKDFLYAHPRIRLENASGVHNYDVVAAVTVDKTDEWYNFISAASAAQYEKSVELILKKAKVKTETVPEYGDRLITLSTCYGSSKSGRLLIIAKEVNINDI